MKQFLIIIISLFTFSYSAVYAVDLNYNPMRLRWKDFCPDGWQDAEYKEIKWYWPYSVRQTQEELNFWALKRDEFEEQINKCDNLLDEFKGQCYWTVKSKFRNDFEDHKLEEEAKKIFNKGIDDNIYRNPRPIMINIIPNH